MTPDELRKIRGRLKWTQTELAQALGVARNTVTRWEIGLVSITEAMAKLVRMIASQERAKKKRGK